MVYYSHSIGYPYKEGQFIAERCLSDSFPKALPLESTTGLTCSVPFGKLESKLNDLQKRNNNMSLMCSVKMDKGRIIVSDSRSTVINTDGLKSYNDQEQKIFLIPNTDIVLSLTGQNRFKINDNNPNVDISYFINKLIPKKTTKEIAIQLWEMISPIKINGFINIFLFRVYGDANVFYDTTIIDCVPCYENGNLLYDNWQLINDNTDRSFFSGTDWATKITSVYLKKQGCRNFTVKDISQFMKTIIYLSQEVCDGSIGGNIQVATLTTQGIVIKDLGWNVC